MMPKYDFAEIMGFFQLFITTYLKEVHTQKLALDSALSS